MLSDEHKQKRVDLSREFLWRHEEEGKEFLNSIVTADETLVHYFIPQKKEQSKQW